MSGLLECVANVSEGRNPRALEALGHAVDGVSGVRLLSVDRSPAANRTVFTYAGSPQQVLQATLNLAQSCLQHIDLRQHQGIHPRIGALDVVPLIPLQGLSLAQTRDLAQDLSMEIAALKIPVYNYAASAGADHLVHLSSIRKGNELGLAQRIASSPEWRPDFGPAQLHPSAGACAIGVRAFMLAWNINLNGPQKLARQIARRIRATGNGKRAGLFPGLKAIGWYTEDFETAQVSTNIMNINAAPMLQVYDTVAQMAHDAGTALNGSELIGCMPRLALRQVAATLGKGAPVTLNQAAAYLGLGKVKPFHPSQHILEEALGLSADLPLHLPS